MCYLNYMQKNQHGVYEYKRRIPKDLLQSYPQYRSGVLKFSLKTKDRAEADKLIKKFDAQFEREFESHRKKNVVPLATRKDFVKRLQSLCISVGDDVDLESLHGALEWIEKAQAKDEPTPFEQMMVNDPVMVLSDNPEKTLARNRAAEYQKIIDTLNEMIRAFHGENSNFKEVDRRYSIASAANRFERQMKVLGAASDATNRVKSNKAVVSGKTLTDLLPLWKNEQKPSGNSVLEWETAVKRFEEYFGRLPLDRIESGHIRDFRDALAVVPTWSGKGNFKKLVEESKKRTDEYNKLSPATVNKNLSAISSLLNIAIEYGYLTTNPANGIKVRDKVSSKEKRLPFDKHDLNKLFNSPLYTGCKSETYRHVEGENIYRDAKYWLPLLALFTGARLEELAQSLRKDIKIEGGIAYLDINPHGGKKSLKTTSSIRKVPLHDMLMVECGFARYMNELQRVKADRLFPKLKLADKNTYSQPISKWFTRYRKEIGITDDKKKFHSFRHTFKDLCRNAGIPQDVHDALTGHGKATVSNSYGSGHSLKVLDDAIQKIEIPVSLKHLQPRSI